jgi:putative cell wall-binding protein
MTTEKFSGEISSAYGNPVSPAIKFDGTFEAYEKYEDVPEKERPDEKELLAFVNNRRKASARQSAMQSALDAAGIKKPTLEDAAVQIREMAKVLLAAKKADSQEAAEAAAKSILGL